MFNPISTYRIQFHKDFTFQKFKSIIPYLKKLGISTLYASPILEATPGSTHGYDGVDPHKINPEIGTEEQLREITKELAEGGIRWLQDIVPNHMAYHINNSWLMDVFEHGEKSFYYNFFDIGWKSSLYQGRVMVPFLGASLEETINKGELKVTYSGGKFVFNYYDTNYPLGPHSYLTLLNSGTGEKTERIKIIEAQIRALGNQENYTNSWTEIRQQLSSLMEETNSYLSSSIENINNDKELLKKISDQQVYQLCYWQETDYQINFRRFFTINGLLCLNIQDKNVFNHYHQYINSLLQEGIFQGLRIDHIDGLYDPTLYLGELREMAGPETYVVVEKILEPGEDLPPQWPIQGNTGYDFLSLVNNLLTNKQSEGAFTAFYNKLSGNETSIHSQIREKKAYILYHGMAGELENLTQLFTESNLATNTRLNALPPGALKTAIAEILIECPVYRYYGNKLPLQEEEERALKEILTNIRHKDPNLTSALDILETTIISQPKDGDSEYNQRALKFYQRLMQFSGPLMAKGVEDTLMYTYNRFIGNNEVGDSPETFGIASSAFHEEMIKRQKYWPLTLNATATHDTKRGEDVSARLNVITDLPEEWLKAVQEWQKLNIDLKINGAPDVNDEYLIYQALLGAFPLVPEEEATFSERFGTYLSKALREAKINSNWTTPNEEYESAAKNFADSLLDKSKPFWKSFEKFKNKISDFGVVNSLIKVVLKFTCPGVPDIYQGCELWDQSLVDPDNRRPVNYPQRIEWLDKLSSGEKEKQEALLKTLWEERSNANIKLWLVHTLLNERKQSQTLFQKGHYLPLEVEGKFKDHILAFARQEKQSWYVVAVPLHLAALCKQQKKEIHTLDWKDTKIILPVEVPEKWEHVLEKSKGNSEKGILIQDIFQTLPLALLKLELPKTERSAGVLMHISSLPSPFGIGDFGPEAKSFADFLNRSYQKYWQILPLNITEEGNTHSPYSSISSMAGNILLISPEKLAEDGFLNEKELEAYRLPSAELVDYKEASRIKDVLLDKAFHNFHHQDKGSKLEEAFHLFCEQEAIWLDDFALYVKIKEEQKGNPWYTWPKALKLREKETLKSFQTQHADALRKIKWLQFIFSEQWHALKDYCNDLGIQLFGDLPFYVSYDSADVWSNPDIFSLDEEGNITGVAGVPPDYFNSDGQLWGMPVFKWDVLKKRNYDWWIQRIKKNLELYNILRLDHFRAFADFWEVPATEKTAKNGKWKPGPGADFFKAIQNAIGSLPFIAEDLGDINEEVHQLRDDFNLPGMKVLQFAFGDDMPGSIYIPHNYQTNYFAYTGTHDNNTTVGWFRQDAGKQERKNLELYTGLKPNEKNIHQVLGKLAYASVAKTAILPLQDVLGLDENSRMNMPASIEKNWIWRMKPGQLTKKEEGILRQWVKLYNR